MDSEAEVTAALAVLRVAQAKKQAALEAFEAACQEELHSTVAKWERLPRPADQKEKLMQALTRVAATGLVEDEDDSYVVEYGLIRRGLAETFEAVQSEFDIASQTFQAESEVRRAALAKAHAETLFRAWQTPLLPQAEKDAMLFRAIAAADEEAVASAIAAQADVLALNRLGESPLHVAVLLCSDGLPSMGGLLAIVKLLIACGADLYQEDGAGCTPLDVAHACGSPKMRYTLAAHHHVWRSLRGMMRVQTIKVFSRDSSAIYLSQIQVFTGAKNIVLRQRGGIDSSHTGSGSVANLVDGAIAARSYSNGWGGGSWVKITLPVPCCDITSVAVTTSTGHRCMAYYPQFTLELSDGQKAVTLPFAEADCVVHGATADADHQTFTFGQRLLETQPLFVSAGEARREPLIEGCSWEQ